MLEKVSLLDPIKKYQSIFALRFSLVQLTNSFSLQSLKYSLLSSFIFRLSYSHFYPLHTTDHILFVLVHLTAKILSIVRDSIWESQPQVPISSILVTKYQLPMVPHSNSIAKL